MSRESTQESLLSRVRDVEDDAAWREFDAKYRDLVLRYCRRRGLDPNDGEDVRQLLMMGLARSMRTFAYRPDRGRFRDYLYRGVRNAISRHLSCRNDAARPLFPDEAAEVVDPRRSEADQQWEAEWRNHHLRQAMVKAEHVFRGSSLEVFRRLLAGDAAPDVAAAFGMTAEAVYKVKERVRAFLEERVVEQLREEEFTDDGRG